MVGTPNRGTSPGASQSHRVAAAAVMTLALLVAVLHARLVGERDRADARAGVVRTVSPVAADLSAALAETPAAAAEEVARVLPDGLEAAGMVWRDDVVGPSAVVARDTGEAVLVVDSNEDDAAGQGEGAVSVGVLVPVYRDGPALTVAPPRTTVERRARSAGVVLVDRSDVVGGLLAPSRADGLDLVLRAGATEKGDAASVAVSVGPEGTGLELVAAVPSTGVAGRVVLVVFGGVVGLALGAAILASGRRERRLVEDLDHTQRDLESVLDVVPVVQQSLDLGDVLPAVAVAMTDAFGLRGVQVTMRGGAGDVEVFAAGAAVGTEDGHEAIELPLQRGNRLLGTLRVLPGATLDPRQESVLRLLGDLVAAALANASLYVQQQAAVDRLREVDELKTVFLATASHELRTPITAISGFANVLHTSWDSFGDAERQQFAERISVNAKSLEHLIGQLLDFSRMEAGRLDEGATLDLGATVEAMRITLESQVADHDLRLGLDGPVWVRGTRGAVERIVSNLVGNAGKYSPSGTAIEVTITVDDSEPSPGDAGGAGRAVLTVDDAGGGVAPADRERIFDRFYRGGGEEVLRTRGAGVGLSIVRDFVDALDGTIEVGESPAGGARFTVTLPCVPAPAEDASADDPEAARVR